MQVLASFQRPGNFPGLPRKAFFGHNSSAAGMRYKWDSRPSSKAPRDVELREQRMMWLFFAFSGPLLWAVSTHLDKYLVERYFKDSSVAALLVFTALIGVLAAGLAMTGAAPVPAYVEALLERNAESTDNLIRAVQKVEESRQSAAAGNAALVERLAALAEATRTQQNLLARFTELSIELRAAVTRLSDRSGAEADRDREDAEDRGEGGAEADAEPARDEHHEQDHGGKTHEQRQHDHEEREELRGVKEHPMSAPTLRAFCGREFRFCLVGRQRADQTLWGGKESGELLR